MIAAAKMRSPARLIALDCSEHRLELARLCGAEVVSHYFFESSGELVVTGVNLLLTRFTVLPRDELFA